MQLTKNQLKILAIVCMTIDHIGVTFFPHVPLLRMIGRLAFPIFSYGIAEGCRFTRNKFRYFGGVFLCGVVCVLAFLPVGGFYGTTDIDVILVSESSPTNLRSSILSAQFLAMGVGYVVTYAVGLPLITVLGNGKVPAISLCLAVPGMFLSLVVKMTRVHETKGVDLDKITGTEWD